MARVTVPLDELATAIDTERTVWVRVAAVESGGEWYPQLLELTSGSAPPSWKPLRWAYASAFLVASKREGAAVARWLRKRAIILRSLRISLAHLADQAWCERRASRSKGIYEPLPWPTDEWHMASSSQPPVSSVGELVAENAPSFMSLQTAVESLLGVEGEAGGGAYSTDFVFRREGDSARIDSVHIRPAEVQVRVEGRRLRGALVELAGNQPGPTRRLARNGTTLLRFPLQSGLQSGAWVLVRRGDAWLDRRFLNWPYARGQEPGVEIEIEPSTRVEMLVAEGEGPTIEFKETLPGDDDDSKRKVMKTVAAFANGEGGYILFGVSNDGVVVGLGKSDTGRNAQDRLAQLVRDWVSPLVHFGIEALAVPDRAERRVLVLTVERGEHPPYGAGTKPTNIVYYARRGATSFALSASEVRTMARSRPLVDQAKGYLRQPQS